MKAIKIEMKMFLIQYFGDFISVTFTIIDDLQRKVWIVTSKCKYVFYGLLPVMHLGPKHQRKISHGFIFAMGSQFRSKEKRDV